MERFQSKILNVDVIEVSGFQTLTVIGRERAAIIALTGHTYLRTTDVKALISLGYVLKYGQRIVGLNKHDKVIGVN